MAIPPIKHLEHLHQNILGAGVAIVGIGSDGLVTPAFLQAAAQPTITAFVDTDAVQTDWENTQARTVASDAIATGTGATPKGLRAAASIMVDEVNILRQWIVSFKAQVAAATSLADLKTRVAALPDLPDRTMAQAKTAMQNKITSGSVD